MVTIGNNLRISIKLEKTERGLQEDYYKEANMIQEQTKVNL